MSLRAPLSHARSPRAPDHGPTRSRRPWVEHWLDTCGDLQTAEGVASDDGRRHRRDRRPHDQDRRSLARRLRVVQLPRLRPRSRDHRGDPRVPRCLGHPPELVATARQPRHLRADRGAAHRDARQRGLARPADDHAHPHVRDPAARRVGHDLPGLARTQDDLRRLSGRPRARRGGQAVPLRGSRPPRPAAALRARPHAARVHGRRQQHDRQRAGHPRVRCGRPQARRAALRRRRPRLRRHRRAPPGRVVQLRRDAATA